jgi:hypothetical protein
MMWFFEQASKVLELETRYDNETLEYVLELRPPDAAPTLERFSTNEAFRTRLADIEQRLASDQWRQVGPPHVLPEGWPDRTPFW